MEQELGARHGSCLARENVAVTAQIASTIRIVGGTASGASRPIARMDAAGSFGQTWARSAFECRADGRGTALPYPTRKPEDVDGRGARATGESIPSFSTPRSLICIGSSGSEMVRVRSKEALLLELCVAGLSASTTFSYLPPFTDPKLRRLGSTAHDGAGGVAEPLLAVRS